MPIPNENAGLEDNVETLRDTHLKSQRQGMQESQFVPSMDRLTLIPSRDRRIISENMRIG